MDAKQEREQEREAAAAAPIRVACAKCPWSAEAPAAEALDLQRDHLRTHGLERMPAVKFVKRGVDEVGPCLCGCGAIAAPGRKFIKAHHLRMKRRKRRVVAAPA